MSFIDDIKGQNTQLYPIVTIEAPTPTNGEDVVGGWIPELAKAICLSTNNTSLSHIYRLAYEEGNPQGYVGYDVVGKQLASEHTICITNWQYVFNHKTYQ